MLPKLEYQDLGRGGFLVYSDDSGPLRFFYEFGGGHCVAIICVPAEEEWEEQTGRPLSERAAVLDFVGGRVVRDKAPHCRVQAEERALLLLGREEWEEAAEAPEAPPRVDPSIRPAPLYGLLFCALFIIVLGSILWLHAEAWSGYLPPGRSGGGSRTGVINGPGAVLIGLGMAAVALYSLWRGRLKR